MMRSSMPKPSNGPPRAAPAPAALRGNIFRTSQADWGSRRCEALSSKHVTIFLRCCEYLQHRIFYDLLGARRVQENPKNKASHFETSHVKPAAEKNPRIGSSLESWLDEMGIREEATREAIKYVSKAKRKK